jgi:hypothetical protein
MKKKTYPLVVSKEIENLLTTFRKIIRENSEIIEIKETNDLIYIVDKEKPEFRFRVYNPSQNRDLSPVFSHQFLPENEVNFESVVRNDKLDKIVSRFNQWISYLKDYNEICFTEEEKLMKFYEDEYFHEFEILEEDAEINPFAENQQIFLYKFLSLTSQELNKINSNDLKLNEIISDTNELKDNIQNLTKKEVIIKMSKVFARIKKFSLKLALDIFDVAKKEIIKKALYGGTEDIGQLLNSIS